MTIIAMRQIKPEPVMMVQWTGDNAYECMDLDDRLLEGQRLATDGDASILELMYGNLAGRVPVGWWVVRERPGSMQIMSPEYVAEYFEPIPPEPPEEPPGE